MEKSNIIDVKHGDPSNQNECADIINRREEATDTGNVKGQRDAVDKRGEGVQNNSINGDHFEDGQNFSYIDVCYRGSSFLYKQVSKMQIA